MVTVGADQRCSAMTKKLSHDPAHWHDRADDARRVAAEILDPVSRRKMLEIAESYDSLARREAERRHVQSPSLERMVPDDPRATEGVVVTTRLPAPGSSQGCRGS
jgi:hypothetical protein